MAITDITIKFKDTYFTIHQYNPVCYAVLLDLRSMSYGTRNFYGMDYAQFESRVKNYPIKSVSVVNSTCDFNLTDVREYIKVGMKGAGLNRIAHEEDIIKYYRSSDGVHVRTDMSASRFSGLDIYAINSWIRKLWENAGEVKTALDVLKIGKLKNKYKVAYILSLSLSKKHNPWTGKEGYVAQDHYHSHSFAPSTNVLNTSHIDALLHWHEHPDYMERAPYRDDIRCTGWHDLFFPAYDNSKDYEIEEFESLVRKVDALVSLVEREHNNV